MFALELDPELVLGELPLGEVGDGHVDQRLGRGRVDRPALRPVPGEHLLAPHQQVLEANRIADLAGEPDHGLECLLARVAGARAAESVALDEQDRIDGLATRLGTFGQILYAVSPKVVDQVMNTAYNIFPDSKAAKGDKKPSDGGKPEERAPEKDQEMSTEAIAMAYLMRGVHF